MTSTSPTSTAWSWLSSSFSFPSKRKASCGLDDKHDDDHPKRLRLDHATIDSLANLTADRMSLDDANARHDSQQTIISKQKFDHDEAMQELSSRIGSDSDAIDNEVDADESDFNGSEYDTDDPANDDSDYDESDGDESDIEEVDADHLGDNKIEHDGLTGAVIGFYGPAGEESERVSSPATVPSAPAPPCSATQKHVIKHEPSSVEEDTTEKEDWQTATKKALTNVEDLSGLDASVLNQTWPESTLTILDRISNRGHEPLLPISWKWDFRFIPDILFTPANIAQTTPAFISPLSTDKQTHAVKALADLFKMAARARDAEEADHHPEVAIASHIERYHTWALLDADLITHRRQARRAPRLVITVTGTKTQSPQDLTETMRLKFARLERQWLEVPASGGGFHNRPLPTFYGFMISYSVVALWSYEPVDRSIGMKQPRSSTGTGALRSIALFQTGQRGYDVWNALIVAIVIVQARNEMVGMVRDGVLLTAPEEDEEVDPDA